MPPHLNQLPILKALSHDPATVNQLVRRLGRDVTRRNKRSLYHQLRHLEDHNHVRRTDERITGEHVWQLTATGRTAIEHRVNA